MSAFTHDVSIGMDVVVKRFRSWNRGEPDREWSGLTLLARYAPGLAPTPVARERSGGCPAIAMTRLDGRALGSGVLSEREVAAVASAFNALHSAVPTSEVASLPHRLWHPAEAVTQLREAVQDVPDGVSVDVRLALEAGAEWILSADAGHFAAAEVPHVFGHADGNLANFVWDGTRCALVDFEDSGRSDSAYEIADLVEHLSSWLTGVLPAERLLAALDLDAGTAGRVRDARRVMALFWLIMLLPGNPAHRRNAVGSVERQARRLVTLLR